MLSIIQSKNFLKTGVFSLLLLSHCALTTAQNPSTTVNLDPYKGLWLTQINDKAIYLVLKKNNSAHYFYKNGPDSTVYKGTWLPSPTDPNSIELHWNSGDSHSFNITQEQTEDSSSLKAKRFEATKTVEKLADTLLGSWARPYDYIEPQNESVPSGYFGLWQIQNDQYYELIRIQENRLVYGLKLSKALSKNSLEPSIGRWAKHGEQIHILWEHGTYMVIDDSDRNAIKLYRYSEGNSILENEADTPFEILSTDIALEAQKAWDQHSAIIDNLNSIQLNSLNYKSLNKFYRGDWIVSGAKGLGFMQLGRFGGVHYYSQQISKGNWYLSGTGLSINLDNGSRLRLQAIGTGFLVSLYNPRQPLDSYPNQVFRATPLEKEKLYRFSVKPSSAIAFWEENSKWASLSDSKKAYLQTLQNLSQKDVDLSPWWWPIWSDQVENPQAVQNKSSKDLTNSAASIASSVEESKKTHVDVDSHRKLKSSWQWPF